MKVQELIKIMNSSNNKMLKDEQKIQVIIKTLNVKNYISIKEKKDLIDNIIKDSVLYEDGMFKFNEIDKYIIFTMYTINKYTDLELSDDIENDYDVLCENNLLGLLIDSFSGEYHNISSLLGMQTDSVLLENSTNIKLNNLLDTINIGLDKFIKILSDKLSTIDLSKLNISEKDLDKLMKFLNK